MTSTDAQVILAMPLGLLELGEDPATFYELLATRIQAELSEDQLLSIHSEPAFEYSGVYPMVRAAVWYVPAGGAGLDGNPVPSPTLYCRTWLWEFLTLRSSIAGGDVPAVIAYANLDETTVREAITAEVDNNPAYGELTESERTELIDAFMTQEQLMLFEAGTRLGQGAIDSSHASGYRLITAAFYDSDNLLLEPPFFFSLWDSIGGEWVTGHPLVALLRAPFTPAIAPLEGSIRIKFTQTSGGLTSGSSVEVGGTPASEIRADSNGTSLYFMIPAGSAGPVEIIIDGIPYPGVFHYVEDVVATAQASRDAYLIHLTEIKALADEMRASGTLDEEAQEQLLYELEGAAFTVGDVVALRSYNAGAAALDSAAGQVLADAAPTFQTLMEEASSAITA